MIADGTFPGPTDWGRRGCRPAGRRRRAARLEPDGTILYASPNSLSAFSRLGRHRLRSLGEPIDDADQHVADDPFDASDLATAVEACHRRRQPASIEVDGGGATVLFRALPLRPHGETLGPWC